MNNINILNKDFLEDPLKEKASTKIKGLVYKYPGRAMILLTLKCVSKCHFCTRGWFINKEENELSKTDIKNIVNFIAEHKEIVEVIISGGDPLLEPKKLDFLLNLLEKLEQIKVLRIHTKLPISNPGMINNNILKIFKKQKKILYISLHINNINELTEDTVEVIEKIRKTGVILYSQSVFIKGLNDSVDTLKKLFTKLIELGVKPYYIYHCDEVRGLDNFIVPIEKEITIMTNLRKLISGLAYPIHVVDSINGKIPIPLNFWDFNKESFKDFKGKKVNI